MFIVYQGEIARLDPARLFIGLSLCTGILEIVVAKLLSVKLETRALHGSVHTLHTYHRSGLKPLNTPRDRGCPLPKLKPSQSHFKPVKTSFNRRQTKSKSNSNRSSQLGLFLDGAWLDLKLSTKAGYQCMSTPF
jgi:hypothetical protein